jgi:hypothetical protein
VTEMAKKMPQLPSRSRQTAKVEPWPSGSFTLSSVPGQYDQKFGFVCRREEVSVDFVGDRRYQLLPF